MRKPRRTTLSVVASSLTILVISSHSSGASSAEVDHAAALASGSVSLISVTDAGEPSDVASRLPAARPVVSHHGRYVVFQSRDGELAGDDTNGLEDVFVRDSQAGTTQLVSHVAGVAVGGGGATVSANGRYVAFLSASPDLSPDDTNGNKFDVFVRDMSNGELTLVSRATDGSQRNRDSDGAVISADGSRVAFLTSARLSAADHDPAGEERWKQQDVYVHNLAKGTTRLASVKRSGDDFVGPVGLGGLSADGSTVGFTWGSLGRNSRAPGGYYVRDLAKPGSILLWEEKILAGGVSDGAPAISGDGRVAAFASDSNGVDPDPNYPVYDVAVVDLDSGERIVVSNGLNDRDAHGDSWAPTLSYGGGVVAFASEAPNLVRRDNNDFSDVFRYEVGQTMTLVSRGSDAAGNLASGFGGGVAISGDGQSVAFHSFANNLISDDTNSNSDVFLWSSVE